MSDFQMFMQLDFPVFAAGAMASIACALIGSFLVLRRMSLMGDAISHAVLPGIVAAFLLHDTAGDPSVSIFIGAAVVGVVTAFLTELVHRFGRVEPGASMGVVFTVLFAIGVIWLEQVGGRNIHLDADCVLYGAMENVIWPEAPETIRGLASPLVWRTAPPQLATLAAVIVVNLVFLVMFFKELRITSFDSGLAASQGVNPNVMHYLLMTFVAITTVASFEAVGSILVVAMLIVPPLVAHLLTDRLVVLLVLSPLVAVCASTGGYIAAATWSVSAAGMIGLALGALLVITGLLAPRHGWISRLIRRTALGMSILREDMLGLLYRVGELDTDDTVSVTMSNLRAAVGGGPIAFLAARGLLRRGEVTLVDGQPELTRRGHKRAANVIRSHRLWESYLVSQLGLRPDHVHDTAMQLEHVTDRAMQHRLAEDAGDADTDPHGRDIPDIPVADSQDR